MEYIALESAKFSPEKGFTYTEWQAFPSSAKGLTLAIIAAERMMKIQSHHVPHADIRIVFKDGGTDSQSMDEIKFFDLITRHRAGYAIIEKCQEIIVDLAA